MNFMGPDMFLVMWNNFFFVRKKSFYVKNFLRKTIFTKKSLRKKCFT